ncbi:hypothetical protein [Halarchaeum nitratireducens]|nr:hypothetical protein [Halarchaeum nitratireducens]
MLALSLLSITLLTTGVVLLARGVITVLGLCTVLYALVYDR